MAAFGTDGRCLMRTLQEELDDPGRRRLRALLGLHRAALRQPAGARAGRARRAPPALAPARARGQEDGAGRGRDDAQDPRGRPHRARAGRWPASATAAGGRRWSGGCATGDSTPRWSPAWLTSCGGARGSAGGDLGGGRALRGARRRAGRGSPSAWRPSWGSRRVALVARTGPRPPQREMANAVQQAANVRGAFRVIATPPPRHRACCSTTGAARAGRWPWSAGSCAAPAPSGSCRSRWGR